jgi:hypothetical protein
VSERTATPFLDERGPRTQLILLNRKSSLPSVSLPACSSHLRSNHSQVKSHPPPWLRRLRRATVVAFSKQKAEPDHMAGSTDCTASISSLFVCQIAFVSLAIHKEHAPSSPLYHSIVSYSCTLSFSSCILFVAGLLDTRSGCVPPIRCKNRSLVIRNGCAFAFFLRE